MKGYRIEERYDLGRLVTFLPNKRLPVYNWFYFKEGFSRDFVMLMADWFGIKRGDWVLDPFCGCGTTPLACKELGVNSMGIDVSPLMLFVSRVKVRDYDLERLREDASSLFSKKFRPVEANYGKLIKRAFPKHALQDLAFLMEEIGKVEDEASREFFQLALMSSLDKVSYAIKDGGVLKFVKKEHIPPLRVIFKRRVKRMIHDLKKVKFRRCEIRLKLADSRMLDFLDDESFDYVITSPPYLNKIEYTKIYSIEHELFIKDKWDKGLRSYIGLRPKSMSNPFPELELPEVAIAYFNDMKMVIEGLYRVLKRGGRVAMVVAEGAFPNGIVPVDLLLSRLFEDSGFSVDRIVVVNRRVVTKDRTLKIGRARESILLVRKDRRDE